MTTMHDLREKGAAELAADGQKQRVELGRVRFQHGAGRLKATHRLRSLRRDLARTLTARNQVEQMAQKESAK